MRSATIAQVVANVFRGKGRRPYTVEDFMPKEPRRTARKQSLQEQKETLLRLVAWAKRTGRAKPKEGMSGDQDRLALR
jgi:hypothetical protein